MNLAGKKILFQGDSITDMARGRNTWDQNHLYGHSYVFLIASKLGFERPKAESVFFNRGNSGDRCIDVLKRWQEEALDLKPDIISLLVGINDIILEADSGNGVTAEHYGETLCKLIEQTQKELPATRFILCEPFCFVGAAKEEYRALFARRVPEHQKMCRAVAKAKGCLFVPLQEDFDAAYRAYPELGEDYWIWDGIHPTAAGQQIIARKWLQTVEGEDRE